MKKIFLLVFIAFPLIAVGQQKTIVFDFTTSNAKHYTLSNITKHTFENGKIVTCFKDGTTTEEFSLSNIYRQTFSTDLVTQNESTQLPTTDFTLYPMPVNETLNLNFSSEQSGILQLSIITMDGCILIRRNKSIKQGVNKFELSISELQSGIYICHLKIDNKLIIKKIIKQ